MEILPFQIPAGSHALVLAENVKRADSINLDEMKISKTGVSVTINSFFVEENDIIVFKQQKEESEPDEDQHAQIFEQLSRSGVEINVKDVNESEWEEEIDGLPSGKSIIVLTENSDEIDIHDINATRSLRPFITKMKQEEDWTCY